MLWRFAFSFMLFSRLWSPWHAIKHIPDEWAWAAKGIR